MVLVSVIDAVTIYACAYLFYKSSTLFSETRGPAKHRSSDEWLKRKDAWYIVMYACILASMAIIATGWAFRVGTQSLYAVLVALFMAIIGYNAGEDAGKKACR